MICVKAGRRWNALSTGGIVGMFLLASLSIQVVAQVPAKPDEQNTLLTRATRMVEVGEPWEQTYFWLSPTRALFITQDYRPAPVPKGDEKLQPASTPSRFSALSITVPSGTINPLAAFNEKFGALLVGEPTEIFFMEDPTKPGKGKGETRYHPSHAALSPDRNSLLFWDRTNSQWVIASLTGIRSYSWPTEDNANIAYWLRDGRRWLEWREGRVPGQRMPELKSMIIHSLDNPRTTQEIPLEHSVKGSPLGMTGKGNPVVDVMDQSTVFEGTLKLVQPLLDKVETRSDKTAPLETTIVKLPRLEGKFPWCMDSRLSDSGTRLALMVAYGKDLQSANAFPAFFSLLVCDLDGENMVELGRVIRKTRGYATIEEAKAHPVGFNEGKPGGLGWLPDEKRISFVYEKRLYTIPVK